MLHTNEDLMIGLKVYTFAAADAPSHALDEVGRPHIIPDPLAYEQIPGFPRFCFIKNNGEFYVKKVTLDDYEPFSIGFDFIKHSVLVYLDFLHAINSFSKEVVRRYLDPAFVERQISSLESILRCWDGNATNEDAHFVGVPLNPFQTNELEEMINEAESIERERSWHMSAAKYAKEADAERRFEQQIKAIAEKICENQNRPNDILLFGC